MHLERCCDIGTCCLQIVCLLFFNASHDGFGAETAEGFALHVSMSHKPWKGTDDIMCEHRLHVTYM